MESAILTAITTDTSEARVTVIGVPDLPGKAAHIFRALSENGINIDMVLQNWSSPNGFADITFTCPRESAPAARAVLDQLCVTGYGQRVRVDEAIAKVSLRGVGIKSHPAVTATFTEALEDEGINMQTLTTSELQISALVQESEVRTAESALRGRFELVVAAH